MLLTDHIRAALAGKSVWQWREEQLGEPVLANQEVVEGSSTRNISESRELETRGLVENTGDFSHYASTLSRLGPAPLSNQLSAQAAVRDGFEAAGIVFTCVEKIARTVSSVPLDVMEVKRNGKLAPSKSREARELRKLLETPNISWPWPEFAHRLMQHILLTGNGLTRKTPWMSKEGFSELWLIGPDGVKPKPDSKGIVRQYEWRAQGSRLEVIPRDEIVHIQLPHPINPHWGMSPLMAAARSVDLDVGATDFQRHTLKNQGRPSGVLSTKAELKQEAYNQRRASIKEDVEGAENAGRILFLDGDSKFSPMTLTPLEMAYLESRQMTRADVCAIFGTPPPVVGYYDNATYNNISTARLIFWLDTVIPYLNLLCRNFNHGIAKAYDSKLRIRANLDGVEALAPLRQAQLTRALQLKKLGYPLDTINEFLELGLPMLSQTGE